jgi:hypothetical protein
MPPHPVTDDGGASAVIRKHCKKLASIATPMNQQIF